jgi:hypothetical protein
MGIEYLTDYLNAAKNVLDIFKGIRAELPKNEKTDDLTKDIERAEGALQKSKAKLAQALGYNLCQCTFPPQIMLWHENERAHICPNSQCGRRIQWPQSLTGRATRA